MGFFSAVATVVLPVLLASGAAFSLRQELPVAGRWFGRRVGLGYVYFKAVVKVLRPNQQQTDQILGIVRQVDQQTHAFQREFKSELYKAREQVKAAIPPELTA
jgi:hypothetical protein